MILLTKKQIIIINGLTIEEHGGNFMPPSNLLHENALDYLIEIVDSSLFGLPMYPQIHHKAGVYLYNIISNHIFTDGNKRTGLEAALIFLKLNGYKLSDTITNSVLTEFVISVASGAETLESVQLWLDKNIVSL